MKNKKQPLRLVAMALILLATACSITGGIADGLNQGVQNQRDPQLVAEGLPTYILIVDGLLARDPQSETLLLAAAGLYGAYGGNFVDDPERAKLHTTTARDYAHKAFCQELRRLCEAEKQGVNAFRAELQKLDDDDVKWVYGYATAVVSWIQTHSGDFNAIAALPKVEAMLERVTALKPALDNGNPWIYRGVLASQVPPALGGKPEVARAHFEKAIEVSAAYNLMAKALYAEYYARLVFDQELHDRLLEQVLAADGEAPSLTLTNVLAKEKAAELLESGKEYF
ncbi:MAG: TRAP transporter TatT component family protein [Gammaproteobacteria bacterium]|nr:TRAP transporter TatT component family protein [Gammaproteobacteria bacterium]